MKQPFRGWNEGSTHGTTAYLLGTYFRQLPSNKRKRLDVIPVDLVCRGLTLISAAMVSRATRRSTSWRLRRSIRLICAEPSSSPAWHIANIIVLSKGWNTGCAPFQHDAVSKARYTNVSLPRFQRLIEGAQKIRASDRWFARKGRWNECKRSLNSTSRSSWTTNTFLQPTISKFLPEPCPKRKSSFDYNAEVIDWYDYWINLHVPALRRWTYPLIEGRRPETGSCPGTSNCAKGETPQPVATSEGKPAAAGPASSSTPLTKELNRAVGE